MRNIWKYQEKELKTRKFLRPKDNHFEKPQEGLFQPGLKQISG